jgi:NAD(P)-dependent dehydrogenase (short-subunit alcohol dehydrogenase family)
MVQPTALDSVGPASRCYVVVPAIPDEAWAGLDAEHATGRVATIEEIASVVAFLGSDEASIVTGAFYLADGGYTAR